MPKAKPVSLHPLSFDKAIEMLMRADPSRLQPKDLIKVHRKTKRTSKKQS
jgi:hypothetical protein